jgi:CRISPR/Cas system CSM-associated protein Csm3 (group 7 of RAMP superfamily)
MATETINKYTITFLSDWQAGSGLSSGADADSVVIKDKNNLPYMPGKTIKGLLKDAFMDLHEVQPNVFKKETIDNYFGSETEKESFKGNLFFSNAVLSNDEQNEISAEMTDFLYKNIASTKIQNNRVAAKSSLRTMEVCIPVVLHGEIKGINNEDVEIFAKALKYLRHLCSNRNRGLGRCTIELKN